MKCIKIGKLNINCRYIPLNPTYHMRKGSEMVTPHSEIKVEIRFLPRGFVAINILKTLHYPTIPFGFPRWIYKNNIFSNAYRDFDKFGYLSAYVIAEITAP